MAKSSREEVRANLSSLHASASPNFDDKQPVDADDDWTSSSGSSSGDESQVEDTSSRPQPHRTTSTNQDLRSRLAAFLPQMEEANKELSDPEQARKHQVDDVPDNEQQYIEMNLGLGVLTEKSTEDNEIRTYEPDSDSLEQDTLVAANNETEKETARQGKKIEEI